MGFRLGTPLPNLVPFAVCGILLAGCASSESMLIADDTALVSVLSQGGGDQAKLVDSALAEAAKMTRAHGYRYFVIVDASDASQRGIKVRQGVPIHIQTMPFMGSRLSSNYLGGATYTGPDRRLPYVRLGLDMTIRMYHDGDVDPASPGVWNSEVVQSGR